MYLGASGNRTRIRALKGRFAKLAAHRGSATCVEGRGQGHLYPTFIAHHGSANGSRTRISALKGPRANHCTIAPQFHSHARLACIILAYWPSLISASRTSEVSVML